MLVLAFGIHDVRPGRSAATYLSSICPGEPNSFAICEQGTLAPFTALRLLRSYAGSGRGVLVVAEQSTVHYQVPADARVPDRHAAVALLLDAAGPGRLVGLSTVDDLGTAVAALAGDREDVTLVTGSGLAGVPPPDGVKHSPGPAGQPYTAAWWQLLDHDTGLVLVADADDGGIGLAAFDFTDPGGTPR